MLGECLGIDNSAAVLAADSLPTSPTSWLGDTGASHHFCHIRDFFTNLVPFSSLFKIQQVLGIIDVTHHGTVTLRVDSASGKTSITLTNVLLVESMQFNIISLQRLRAAGYVYIFDEIPGKAEIKPRTNMEQVALFSETKAGRLTLDCTISTMLPSAPSLRHTENSSDLHHEHIDCGPAAILSRSATPEIDATQVPVGPAPTQFSDEQKKGPYRMDKLPSLQSAIAHVATSTSRTVTTLIFVHKSAPFLAQNIASVNPAAVPFLYTRVCSHV